jgi:hypothetical protein
VLPLLEGTLPEVPVEEILGSSIGRRDSWLLEVHRRSFGPTLDGSVSCRSCDVDLEIHLDESQLDGFSDDPPGRSEPALAPIRVDDYEVVVRLPTSADLIALSRLTVAEEVKQALFSRCLVSARQAGRDATADELPTGVIAAVETAMEEADPKAILDLGLVCSECHAPQTIALDLAAFVQAELETWARRTLQEVAALARAYGWREADVMALPAARRAYYLEAALA